MTRHGYVNCYIIQLKCAYIAQYSFNMSSGASLEKNSDFVVVVVF